MVQVPKPPIIQEHLDDLVRSALDGTILLENHLYSADGCLFFPYHDMDGNLTQFKRWKTFDPDPTNPKYLQEADSGAHVYIPVGFKEHAKDADYILITEGEKKALSLTDENFATVGLGGVDSWKDSKTKQLHPDLIWICKTHKPIYLVFDHDVKPKSKINVEKARARFAQVLMEHGAWKVLNVNLGDKNAGRKCGVDDYLVQYHREEFVKCLEAATLIKPSLPYEEDAATYSKFSEELEVLIDNLACRGHKCMLAGSSKAYKTWLLLNLAISSACGLDWLGHKCKPCKVLYVNLELLRQSCRKRIKVICEKLGVTLLPDTLHIMNLRGNNLTVERLVEHILQRMMDTGRSYDLIIIDPIYKLLDDRNENSTTDTTNLLNNFERLANVTNACIWISHHQTKGSQAHKEIIDRFSGSGAYARDPDVMVFFTKHEEEHCFTVDYKMRDSEEPASIVVRWDFPIVQIDTTLDPSSLHGLKYGEKFTATDAMAKFKDGITSKEWQEALDTSRVTMSKLTKELEESGMVTFIKEGTTKRWYKGTAMKVTQESLRNILHGKA